MRIAYAATAVLSIVVSTAFAASSATAAPRSAPGPTASDGAGRFDLRPAGSRPRQLPVRPPTARVGADVPGDEIVRDGITPVHQRIPVTATPVTGTGPTRSDFDGDGRDDIASFTDNGVIVRYSSAPHRDHLRTEMPGGG